MAVDSATGWGAGATWETEVTAGTSMTVISTTGWGANWVTAVTTAGGMFTCTVLR